jgi:3-oxoacyl-[acyl-carrier-protein] synthase III
VYGSVAGLSYHLPQTCLTTAGLAKEFPEWPAENIEEKTGIRCRHIAGPEETASDLAVMAAEKLFDSGVCTPQSIDFLILCTQSPDYPLPTTACLVQDRLGIPTTAGAMDINLGCSGYIYSLGLAEGLIASRQASSILLITADTWSKYLHPADKSCRALFGDGAAATWVNARENYQPFLGPFVYGSDGRGAPHLIVPGGGMKNRRASTDVPFVNGGERGGAYLFMDGPEVFQFTISVVPRCVDELLDRAGLELNDIDLFVFHQANKYMLEQIRKCIGIPREKFHLAMAHCGNTISSTIPIALKHAQMEGRLRPGSLVMLVGFGVGLSWGATLLRWA